MSRRNIPRPRLAMESTATASGGELVRDHFDVSFEHVDVATLEGRGQKKKGRLGRLTYRFKTADALNGNRRVYPKEVMAQAVTDCQRRVDKGQVFGRLDHPDEWSDRAGIVTIDDAAVMISSLKMPTDTEVEVVFDILDNTDGQRLESVLAVGGNPGTSQRAMAAFRPMDEQEKERYGVPRDEYAVIADALRLITYDIVSDPSFSDAAGAKVTEQKAPDGDPPMNLNELKAKHPDLVQAIVAESRAAVEAEIQTKLTDASTKAANEAREAMQKDLDAIQAKHESLTKALEALKPTMESAGIVNEKITDAEAARRLATAEARVAAIEKENKDLLAKCGALEANVAEHKTTLALAEALKAVHERFKGVPAHDSIIRAVARRKPKTAEEAMAYAEEAADIARAVDPKSLGKAAETVGAGPVSLESLAESLCSSPAKPDAPATGSPAGEGSANESNAGVAALLATGFAGF